jgi:hypothetical protein
MDRPISSIAPSMTYELSAWGKVNGNGETAQIGLLFLDNNGNRLGTEEPTPLTFSSTAFIQQRLLFTVPSHVAEVKVYVYKAIGSAQFYADTLSVTACQSPEALASTPEVIPSVATPAIAGIVSLTEYIDPVANLSVGYPADWRRLTEDEIEAQLVVTDEQAVDAALATTNFIVVSPDSLAAISYTRLQRPPETESLEEVVQAVREANAASVFGIGEITTEPLALDGVDAVKLSFSAADPATGAEGERLIRQLITTRDDSAIILTFILQADAATMYEETVRQIEESLSWRLPS